MISFRHWLTARNLTTLLCVVLKRHHIRYGQRTYLPATSVSGVCVKLLIPAFVHSSANHQIYIFPVIKERLLDLKKEGGKRGDEQSYILWRYWNLRKLIIIFLITGSTFLSRIARFSSKRSSNLLFAIAGTDILFNGSLNFHCIQVHTMKMPKLLGFSLSFYELYEVHDSDA